MVKINILRSICLTELLNTAEAYSSEVYFLSILVEYAHRSKLNLRARCAGRIVGICFHCSWHGPQALLILQCLLRYLRHLDSGGRARYARTNHTTSFTVRSNNYWTRYSSSEGASAEKTSAFTISGLVSTQSFRSLF